jgi:hypothetical protein
MQFTVTYWSSPVCYPSSTSALHYRVRIWIESCKGYDLNYSRRLCKVRLGKQITTLWYATSSLITAWLLLSSVCSYQWVGVWPAECCLSTTQQSRTLLNKKRYHGCFRDRLRGKFSRFRPVRNFLLVASRRQSKGLSLNAVCYQASSDVKNQFSQPERNLISFSGIMRCQKTTLVEPPKCGKFQLQVYANMIATMARWFNERRLGYIVSVDTCQEHITNM